MSDEQPQEQPVDTPTSPTKQPMGVKQKVSLVFATILAICLGSFIIQNLNSIRIDFLWMSGNVRIVYVILSSAIVGGLITFILQRRLKKKN